MMRMVVVVEMEDEMEGNVSVPFDGPPSQPTVKPPEQPLQETVVAPLAVI